MEISIPIITEVDKNLIPPSPEGGTGGRKLAKVSFPLAPEGGTGGREIGENLPPLAPKGELEGRKLVESSYLAN